VTELLNNGTSNAKQDSKISSSALNQTEKKPFKLQSFQPVIIQDESFHLCNQTGKTNYSSFKLWSFQALQSIRLKNKPLRFKAFKLCNENGNPLRRSQSQM
jgi:hypothetical protein